MFRKKLTSIITSAVMCIGMTSGVIAASAEESAEKLYTFDELSAMSDEDFLKLDGAQKLYDYIKHYDAEFYYYHLDSKGGELEVFGGISGWLFGVVVNGIDRVKGKEYTANITEAKIENLLGNNINYRIEGPTDLTKYGIIYNNLSIHCNDLKIDRNEDHDLEISDSNISDMAKFWYCVNQVIELGYVAINESLDPAPGNEKVMTGDVNLDMKIDLTDVDYMEKGLSGELKLTESQMEIADVNGDGTFDELDVEKLKADIAAPTEPIAQAVTVPVNAESTKYGDVNGDLKINVSDVIAINMFLLNTEKYPLTDVQMANADCNKDGVIDTADGTMLMNYLCELIDVEQLGS